jgi:hypothetical protein
MLQYWFLVVLAECQLCSLPHAGHGRRFETRGFRLSCPGGRLNIARLLWFPAFFLDFVQDPAPDYRATIAVLGFALDEGPELRVDPDVSLVAFSVVAHALALRLSAMVVFDGVGRK